MAISLREEVVDFFNGKEDLTMLHISDVHVWFSAGILEKLKALIYKTDPALVVFTGDYFDVPRGAYLFREFLFELSRSYKLVFIRGNHDFVYGARVADLLVGIPNCFCVESSVYSFISLKGYSYAITSWTQRHQLKKQRAGRNIALIHNPEKLQLKDPHSVDLILAGHLHGGQFILFKTANNEHFPGNLLYRHCTDRKQLNNTTLIVSKGLGDTFPFRLNCPREVVKIRIV